MHKWCVRAHTGIPSMLCCVRAHACIQPQTYMHNYIHTKNLTHMHTFVHSKGHWGCFCFIAVDDLVFYVPTQADTYIHKHTYIQHTTPSFLFSLFLILTQGGGVPTAQAGGRKVTKKAHSTRISWSLAQDLGTQVLFSVTGRRTLFSTHTWLSSAPPPTSL